MQILYDEPIHRKEEDVLERISFVKEFSRKLLNIPLNKNITISLNGSWGSGKTSLINLIKREINDNRRYIKSYFPIIIDYSPWNTLNEDGIIRQFFELLIDNFYEEKIKNIINSSNVKMTFDLLTEVPKIGKTFKIIRELLSKYSSCFLTGNENIFEMKKRIIGRLLETKMKFIVFIDDIDRLNNKEIRLLIQLVKAVCDFPNIVYVLSFDKSVVANALSNEQGINGYEYLNKIIQLSIDIPLADYMDIHNYLLNKLKLFFKSVSLDKFDFKRWKNAYFGGFSDYFKTIRDVNRYINTITFNYIEKIKYVDIVDYLLIEAIALFDPNLYYFIINNRSLLCSKNSVSTNKNITKNVLKTVQRYSDRHNLLGYIFPEYSNFLDGDSTNNESNVDNFFTGKLCNLDNLDYYLTGKLNNNMKIKLSVEDFVISFSQSERYEYLKTLNNKEFNDFLKNVYSWFKQHKSFKIVYPEMIIDLFTFEQEFENSNTAYSFANSDWIFNIFDLYTKNQDLDFTRILIETLLRENTNLLLLIGFINRVTKRNKALLKKRFDGALIAKFHKILLKRLEKHIYTNNFIESKNTIEVIDYLNLYNSKAVGEWFSYLEVNDLMKNIIDYFYYVDYGVGATNFLTYKVPYRLFHLHINVNRWKKTISNSIKKGNITLGKVLFIMPEREAPYEMHEIIEFCSERNIVNDFEEKFASV